MQKAVDHLKSKRSFNFKIRKSNKVDTEENLIDTSNPGGDLGTANLIYEEQKESNLNTMRLPSSDREDNKFFGAAKATLFALDSLRTDLSKPNLTMDDLLPCLEDVYVSKLRYKVNIKTDVLDSNLGTLIGKVEHHIIICGYKEGVNYYIESIRNTSNVPIIILAGAKHESKIKKLYKNYTNIFFYKGNPIDINTLQNANVEKAERVIILTNEDAHEGIDNDGIMIANYLQETYPKVKF